MADRTIHMKKKALESSFSENPLIEFQSVLKEAMYGVDMKVAAYMEGIRRLVEASNYRGWIKN